MQLTHYTNKFKKHSFPITVICENVTNAPNIGSLFRICDAFGISELIFCGDSLPIPSRKMQKTSRATEKYVPFRIVDDINDIISNIKETHQIIALEITEKSIPISNHSFDTNQPIALIIGDENFGISDTILTLAKAHVHIEMYGENSSMNVVQATNIALYEITKQFRQ